MSSLSSSVINKSLSPGCAARVLAKLKRDQFCGCWSERGGLRVNCKVAQGVKGLVRGGRAEERTDRKTPADRLSSLGTRLGFVWNGKSGRTVCPKKSHVGDVVRGRRVGRSGGGEGGLIRPRRSDVLVVNGECAAAKTSV